MITEIRTRSARIQAGLDRVCTDSGGCSLAMLADVRTGLVLRRAGSAGLTQEAFDSAAAAAGRLIASPLAATLRDFAAATRLEATAFLPDGDVAVLHDSTAPDEALVCRYETGADRQPARSVFAGVILDPPAGEGGA